MSWRKVADQLASRLAHHAYCDEHPLTAPGPDCPSCRDRAAYLTYVGAGGEDFRQCGAPTKTVTLQELILRHPTTPGGN